MASLYSLCYDTGLTTFLLRPATLRKAIIFSLFCVVTASFGQSVDAATAPQGPPHPALPRFAELEPAVAFWRDVFVKYTDKQSVFHDIERPEIVYSILDISDIVDSGQSRYRSQRALRDRNRAESRRLDVLLKRIAAGTVETDEEKRIAASIKAALGSTDDTTSLVGRIRPQRGLGHQFCEAMERAWPYLPTMRDILWREGVPEAVAALPLVESSYRIDAMSYAGAAGMWQFTRTTGRRYLRIDYAADERRDPLRATEAAARYIRENYDRLGTWPLAITAYNHGEAGIERAVRTLGTTDLSVIRRKYESRTFGFASKNFYLELLAASDVLAEAETRCPGLKEKPVDVEPVELKHYVPIKNLAQAAGMSVEDLSVLNPALNPDVLLGKLWVPRNYQVNVPAGKKEAFAASYAKLPGSALRTSQVAHHATHRVARGQTLSQIAQMYRTSVGSLKTYNNISDPRRLQSGQVIKVPFPGRRPTAIAASSKSGYVTHKVQKGQTLSEIAKLYRTSVSHLKSTNGIHDPRNLRFGQRIKVPD